MIHSVRNGTTGAFTAIEVMITIGIAVILVVIAMPAYHDYTIRSKVTECFGAALMPKNAISEYKQTLGAWPPALEEAGITEVRESKYCNGLVDYDASIGAFSIDINEAAVNPLVGIIEPVLTPIRSESGFIDWHCSSGPNTTSNDRKYLPATCRGG